MTDLSSWINQICTDASVRIFAASDTAPGLTDAMCLPKGYRLTTLLQSFRRDADAKKADMRAAIGASGAALSLGAVAAAAAAAAAVEDARAGVDATDITTAASPLPSTPPAAGAADPTLAPTLAGGSAGATAGASVGAASVPNTVRDAGGLAAIVAASGNPELLKVKGKNACGVCKFKYSSLWVHRGVCYQCEEDARVDGKCPFGKNCKPSSFCPHAIRCFRCDSHSCNACRCVTT